MSAMCPSGPSLSIPTKVIDDELVSQKSVGVATLRRIGASEVPFGKIRQTVTNMLGRSK